MKVAVDLRDRAEGDRVRAVMTDAVGRAVVNVYGELLQLANPKDRIRVLNFVADTVLQDDDTGIRSSARDLPDALRSG